MLSKARESFKKRYEILVKETKKQMEVKDQEFSKMRDQLVEKDKEVKLTSLKLKEFYQSQKNAMSDSQYIEVDKLMKQPNGEWA